MKNINNYIIEKFELNNKTKIQQVNGFNIHALGNGKFITFKTSLLNIKCSDIPSNLLFHIKDQREINDYILNNETVYYIENCDYDKADINNYLIAAKPEKTIGNSLNKCKIYILGNHDYFDNADIGGITVLEHLYKTKASVSYQTYIRDIYISDKILL